MHVLSETEKAKKEECMRIVRRGDNFIDTGRALLIIRNNCLYKDESETLEAFVKKHLGYERRHAYRLISAYVAANNVKDVVCPNGRKIIPRSESIARELAKVEGAQRQAELWVKVHEDTPPEKVTAAKVAEVRRELFGEEPKRAAAAPKEPQAITHIKGMANAIDTILVRLQDVRKEHAVGHVAWVRALNYLDEGRKLLAKLARL